MNNENQENLKELFEKFTDAEQAESCAEDVQKAEEILRKHPAPEPDAMLIANRSSSYVPHGDRPEFIPKRSPQTQWYATYLDNTHRNLGE